ncbi:MAG: hypothetical protein ACI8PZ_000653 [Myxococcota bacterium]
MENNLAVLIDFENIAAGTEKEGLGRFDVEALMTRVKDKGRILLSRSYADWGRFSRFKQSLLTANVTMMELTSHGMQDKNRADIAMVVDALELAFTKDYIHTFVVVSGDSDFTPLVLKMRELNKRVIGCGTRKSTSRLLVNACDEFMFYDSLVAKKQARSVGRGGRPKPKADGPMNRDGAFQLVENAIAGLQRENPDPPLASVVKSAMLRKSPDFSESDLGFPSFARFLEAAEAASHIKIIRDRKSGGYRIDLLSDDRAADPVETKFAWEDPYIPEGADDIVDHLAGRGLHPLGSPTRMALLEALEKVVEERRKRRRKVTVQFVKDDIKKELRRTHPDLPVENVRAILDALLRGGLLIHRDGSAIRNPTASFRLDKGAEELNEALLAVYLRELLIDGPDLDDVGVLAELLLGHADRKRDVEEALAWIAADLAASPPEDSGRSSDGDRGSRDLDLDFDLDSFLVADDSPAPAKPAAESTDHAPSESAADGEAPVVEASDDAVEEEPKRKRKRRRKKEPEPEAVEAATTDDDAPPAKAEAFDELDALLESE